jgi:hypothetical protein
MKLWQCTLIFGIASLAIAQASVERASAWGAIAVGQSGNIAQDGFAFGGAINKPTEDEAKNSAVSTCSQFTGAPKMAAICAAVQSFHGQCYSMAEDPQPGTPGAGWAVGPDAASAAQKAMDLCAQTAGASRVQFCKTSETFCDTHD